MRENGENRLRCLEAKVRFLEQQLSRYEPQTALRIWDLLTAPKRTMSREDLGREVERLLPIIAEKSVSAILEEVCATSGLLEALADACFERDLVSAGQYLTYLHTPR